MTSLPEDDFRDHHVKKSAFSKFFRFLRGHVVARYTVYSFSLASLSIPAFVLSYREELGTSNPFLFLFLFYVSTCVFIGIWGSVVLYSVISLKHLYTLPGFDGKYEAKLYGIIPVRIKLSPKGVLRMALWSYATTIYGFSLIYEIVDRLQPSSFSQRMDGPITAIYFSVATIATVGYGDIAPIRPIARVCTTAEILLGVFYSVFIFSIIASFIKQQPKKFL
ncbi:potassium channel family protein [Bradyrhizobium sp. S69]|uniref:potassium channel family protein n=1 Tax=Bradyrhizobium sp. S69 TaxID=1641856 RepID=UPI00131A6FFD|nr:potassium channel family protein [Bradyrhizobium sp. S69]